MLLLPKIPHSVFAGLFAWPATSAFDIESYYPIYIVPSFCCSTVRYGPSLRQAWFYLSTLLSCAVSHSRAACPVHLIQSCSQGQSWFSRTQPPHRAPLLRSYCKCNLLEIFLRIKTKYPVCTENKIEIITVLIGIDLVSQLIGNEDSALSIDDVFIFTC